MELAQEAELALAEPRSFWTIRPPDLGEVKLIRV